MDELFPTRCTVSPNEVEESRQRSEQATVILTVNIIFCNSFRYMKNKIHLVS